MIHYLFWETIPLLKGVTQSSVLWTMIVLVFNENKPIIQACRRMLIKSSELPWNPLEAFPESGLISKYIAGLNLN